MATHSRLRHLDVAECDEGSLLGRLLLLDPLEIMHCAKTMKFTRICTVERQISAVSAPNVDAHMSWYGCKCAVACTCTHVQAGSADVGMVSCRWYVRGVRMHMCACACARVRCVSLCVCILPICARARLHMHR
jgi:hypothetical protein